MGHKSASPKSWPRKKKNWKEKEETIVTLRALHCTESFRAPSLVLYTMCLSSRLLYQLGKTQRRISAVVKGPTERALTLGHPPTITPVFICTGVLSPGQRGSNIGLRSLVTTPPARDRRKRLGGQHKRNTEG